MKIHFEENHRFLLLDENWASLIGLYGIMSNFDINVLINVYFEWNLQYDL